VHKKASGENGKEHGVQPARMRRAPSEGEGRLTLRHTVSRRSIGTAMKGERDREERTFFSITVIYC
jgi:hypothetical protein